MSRWNSAKLIVDCLPHSDIPPLGPGDGVWRYLAWASAFANGSAAVKSADTHFLLRPSEAPQLAALLVEDCARQFGLQQTSSPGLGEGERNSNDAYHMYRLDVTTITLTRFLADDASATHPPLLRVANQLPGRVPRRPASLVRQVQRLPYPFHHLSVWHRDVQHEGADAAPQGQPHATVHHLLRRTRARLSTRRHSLPLRHGSVLQRRRNGRRQAQARPRLRGYPPGAGRVGQAQGQGRLVPRG